MYEYISRKSTLSTSAVNNQALSVLWVKYVALVPSDILVPPLPVNAKLVALPVNKSLILASGTCLSNIKLVWVVFSSVLTLLAVILKICWLLSKPKGNDTSKFDDV